jgi:hypothetical protein
MALIAILPTGQWAVVESDNDVQYVELTDAQLEHISNNGVSENTILSIDSSCTEENINSILGLD